jgi:hypothetical protein
VDSLQPMLAQRAIIEAGGVVRDDLKRKTLWAMTPEGGH